MSENADILQLLEEQCHSYSRMFEVGSMQRKCIESDDYEALQDAFYEMHRIMDEVRLRQQQIDPLSANGEAAEKYETRCFRVSFDMNAKVFP